MHIFANWKMYLDLEESRQVTQEISQTQLRKEVNTVIFPNSISFCEVKDILKDTDFQLGAQNVSWSPKGAYTGAISAHIFAQAGTDYALVGHSERRHIFGESNEATMKKVKSCLQEDITPVLCVGETKEDLENGDKELVLGEQLSVVFENVDLSAEDIIVGYEPVWAIAGSGEGESCSPVQAEETHHWIKDRLQNYVEDEVEVVYGGSVESDNVLSYISSSNIDGILAGHASANPQEFQSLISKVESTYDQ
ncbi:MAG: triose-phosphate isomerase [Candidatus Magasanikbacteria bacterium]